MSSILDALRKAQAKHDEEDADGVSEAGSHTAPAPDAYPRDQPAELSSFDDPMPADRVAGFSARRPNPVLALGVGVLGLGLGMMAARFAAGNLHLFGARPGEVRVAQHREVSSSPETDSKKSDAVADKRLIRESRVRSSAPLKVERPAPPAQAPPMAAPDGAASSDAALPQGDTAGGAPPAAVDANPAELAAAAPPAAAPEIVEPAPVAQAPAPQPETVPGNAPGVAQPGTIAGAASGVAQPGMMVGAAPGVAQPGMMVGAAPGVAQPGMVAPGLVRPAIVAGAAPGVAQPGMIADAAPVVPQPATPGLPTPGMPHAGMVMGNVPPMPQGGAPPVAFPPPAPVAGEPVRTAAIEAPSAVPGAVPPAVGEPAAGSVLETVPSGAPEVSLLFIKWSRGVQGRVASLRGPGGKLMLVHEGDIVEGMRVSMIRADAVELQWRGTNFLLFAAR